MEPIPVEYREYVCKIVKVNGRFIGPYGSGANQNSLRDSALNRVK